MSTRGGGGGPLLGVQRPGCESEHVPRLGVEVRKDGAVPLQLHIAIIAYTEQIVKPASPLHKYLVLHTHQ